MLVDGKNVTQQDYSRPIDSAFAVYLEKPKQAPYRVQIGTFSTKSGADSYLATVKSFAPDAKVNEVNGLYKIQIDCSDKESAVMRKAELWAFGFVSAFITT